MYLCGLNFIFTTMKKIALNLKTAGLMILAVGTIALTSCGKTKGCTDARADNHNTAAEEDDGSCDIAGTVNKFANSSVQAPWTFTITGAGTYTVYVGSQATPSDYTFLATTNMGLGGNVPDFNLTFNVNKNVATLANAPYDVQGPGNGEISSATFTYNSATSATLTATFVNFDTAEINGTFTDQGTRP
jgi:hypothetical protein